MVLLLCLIITIGEDFIMENAYAKELSGKLKGLDFEQGLKLLKEINDTVEVKSAQWKIGYDGEPECIYEVALGGDAKDNQNNCFIMEQHEVFLILFRLRSENSDKLEKERFLELCPSDGEEDEYLYRLISSESWMCKKDCIADDVNAMVADCRECLSSVKIEWDVIVPDENFVPELIPYIGLMTKNPNNKFHRDGNNELMKYGRLRKALPININMELTKTDFEMIKKITIDEFVYKKPVATEDGFIMHPVLRFWEAFVEDKLVDCSTPEGFKEWADDEARKIREKVSNPYVLIDHIRPADRITYFKYIKEYLSDHDKGSLLNNAWKTCGAINHNPNVSKAEMVSWFKEIDRYDLMEEKDRKGLYELPDIVIIYRGAVGDNLLRGMCWTTDKEVAEYFATEPKSGKVHHVYQTKIKKKDILAYFYYQNTVIIDPIILKKYRPEEIKIEKKEES